MRGVHFFNFQCLQDTEADLNAWREKLKRLHSDYGWLLFFSLNKVLRILSVLTDANVSRAEVICKEICFLFKNSPSTRAALEQEIGVTKM